MTKCWRLLIISLSILIQGDLNAEQSLKFSNDPHYNKLGFFDIHICNWPERPYFFKIIFSSEKYDQIESMNIYMPDNRLLANLNKNKFRSIQRKDKPDKKVYILDIDIPESASTGWYKISVAANDGTIYQAKDYVIMTSLEKVSAMYPSGDEEAFSLPITLKWKPVTGSKYYKVFVRDAWTEELVFSSKLIDTPEIKLPDNKIEPGGDYYWVVHARDSNEHILLGDFHMGSMSKKTFFTVAE